MEEVRYLVVVAIIEGNHFDSVPVSGHGPGGEAGPGGGKEMVYVEARFNGEVLVSDPVGLSASPQFVTELAWEVGRKSLHLFRVQRKPIKLQCFIENLETREKRLVGYSILDLRGAQEQDEPRFGWKPLLNSKYKGPSRVRPELLLALQLIKCQEEREMEVEEEEEKKKKKKKKDEDKNDVDVGTKGEDQVVDQKKPTNGTHSSLKATDNLLENDIRVKLSRNCYKIWDSKHSSEESCLKIYSFSVIIAFASDLYKLVRFPAKLREQPKFCFKFTLFGSPVITEPFTDLRLCEIPVEQIAFKIATSEASTLATYFTLNPTLEIQLCDAGDHQILGFVTISLTRLKCDDGQSFNPIHGQFKLLPNDEAIAMEEPAPVVGVSIEVVEVKETQRNPIAISPKTRNRQTIKSVPTNDLNFSKKDQVPSIRHFCFSIDLRSIQITSEQQLSANPCFLQYSYAFFGYVDKVKTSLVELKNVGEETIFKQAFFAFNFASAEQQVEHTFAKMPLVVEFVEQTSINILRAVAQVSLEPLFGVEPDEDQKKVMSTRVNLRNSSEEKIGQVQVIVCLQDLGIIELGKSVLSKQWEPPSFCVSISASDSTLKGVDDLLMEAALEIEVWKQRQVLLFQEEMKRTEKDYLQTVGREVRDKERQRDKEVKAKLQEIDRLEEQLKSALTDLKLKEEALAAKETDLDAKQRHFKLRFERLDDEISNAITDIKSNYEERFGGDKYQLLEEGTRKMKARISELELRLKAKEENIKELEVKNMAKGNQTCRSNPMKRSALEPGLTNRLVTKSLDIKSTGSGNNGPKFLAKTTSKSALLKSPNESNGTKSNLMTERKAVLLKKLSEERRDLLSNGICHQNDPMIKEIESELIKHGFSKSK